MRTRSRGDKLAPTVEPRLYSTPKLCRFSSRRAEHDLRLTLGEQLGGGLTDPAAAAGYDYYLAVYSIHVPRPCRYEIVQRLFLNPSPKIKTLRQHARKHPPSDTAKRINSRPVRTVSPETTPSRIPKDLRTSPRTSFALYYLKRRTSILGVPVSSADAAFVFNEQTGNYQAVAIQGQLTYRIVEPRLTVEMLNYVIDPKLQLSA